MKSSELRKKLEELEKEHGDIEVCWIYDGFLEDFESTEPDINSRCPYYANEAILLKDTNHYQIFPDETPCIILCVS